MAFLERRLAGGPLLFCLALDRSVGGRSVAVWETGDGAAYVHTEPWRWGRPLGGFSFLPSFAFSLIPHYIRQRDTHVHPVGAVLQVIETRERLGLLFFGFWCEAVGVCSLMCRDQATQDSEPDRPSRSAVLVLSWGDVGVGRLARPPLACSFARLTMAWVSVQGGFIGPLLPK